MKVFKVLIVEDVEKDAKRLRDVLRKELLPKIADQGVESVEAWVVTNQADADKAVLDTGPAGREGFDLVLLDLRYPEVPDSPISDDTDAEFQGMKWLPTLRRVQPRATVVILTSYAHSNDFGTAVRAIRDCQAHDVVPKNTSIHDLSTRIVLACEYARRSEKLRRVQREFHSLIHAPIARTYAEDLARALEQGKAAFFGIARGLESGDPTATRTAPDDIRSNFAAMRDDFAWLTKQLCEGEDDCCEVDVGVILRDLAVLYEDWFRDAKARIVPPDDDLSLKCTTYASDLKIALDQVIVNAAESLEQMQDTPPKDRCCRLTAKATPDGIEIRVVDNGPGFSDAAMQRMFQLPERTDGVRLGRGKGLYVARRMMHSIGGDIQLRNLPQGGAEIMLTVRDLSRLRPKALTETLGRAVEEAGIDQKTFNDRLKEAYPSGGNERHA